jgi:hypothetical protein
MNGWVNGRTWIDERSIAVAAIDDMVLWCRRVLVVTGLRSTGRLRL